MTSKIRVLTDHTINKIAAGEVIENPASVIKELVENSLDAGATDICIEIKGGGRQLIRITDNGCGMTSDDALLCLERHATSKIREVEDILSVTTMGFRGEAIPSIASISKFTLLTCPQADPGNIKNNEQGTLIIVDGGKIISCTPAARSPGTTIEVKALFFNVPVRKKFLKSPSVDTNEILKIISLISLGYPHIKFQLICDGKNLLMAPIGKDNSFADQLISRIESVLGQDFQNNASYIEHETNGLKIQGVIGNPNYTRHNRTGQYLFINHRPVTSPLVSFAVKDGYGTTVQQGRHPVFVLHLTIPGSLVDVNVHPQKREVRLRQEQQIKDLIIKAIEQNLQKPQFTPHSYDFPEVKPSFEFPTKHHFQSPPTSNEWIFQPKSFLPKDTPQPSSFPQAPSTHYLTQNIPHFDPTHSDQTATPSPIQNPTQQLSMQLALTKLNSPPRVIATIPRYILLDGSSDSEFIVNGYGKGCFPKGKGGLLLIDQKAAHSRVIFEKLQSRENGQSSAQQTLLIPFTIDVSPAEASALQDSLPLLNQMGIKIHAFGTQSFIIEAIPQVFGNCDLHMLFSDILHALRETHGNEPFKEHNNKRIALFASRAAVSNTQRLSCEEAQALINQLAECKHPYHCPQGKPTIIQLSGDELAKYFQKI